MEEVSRLVHLESNQYQCILVLKRREQEVVLELG